MSPPPLSLSLLVLSLVFHAKVDISLHRSRAALNRISEEMIKPLSIDEDVR